MDTKVCTKCGCRFPNTRDYFHSNRERLLAQCKWCRNKRKRETDQIKGIDTLRRLEMTRLVRECCMVHREEAQMAAMQQRRKARERMKEAK